MDEARVVINLREGIIELQGPVEFVRRYLDKYQFAVKGPGGDGLEKSGASPTQRPEARRARTGKTGRGSCTGTIRGYLKQGYFEQPRSVPELKQHLGETGASCADSAVRASLRRLSRAGALETTGAGRALRYRQATLS